MRWLEAIHILDITAETVSRAMLSGCIARFGCPETITTDQGHQFESQFFHSLANIVVLTSLGQPHITTPAAHQPSPVALQQH